MKYLFYELESDGVAKVYFDSENDSYKDLGNYIEVEKLPKIENKGNKIAVLYCNPDTKDVWYKYIDKPKNKNEKMRQEMEKAIYAILNL